jgi:transcriptional regulator with XRE-family HTH domain
MNPVKQIRTARNLTQKQLAKILQVDVSAIGSWEGNKRKLTPIYETHLVTRLELTPEEIKSLETMRSTKTGGLYSGRDTKIENAKATMERFRHEK